MGCGSAKVGVGMVGVGMVGVYRPRWISRYVGCGSAKVGVGMVGVDWPRWVRALLGHMCFTC